MHNDSENSTTTTASTGRLEYVHIAELTRVQERAENLARDLSLTQSALTTLRENVRNAIGGLVDEASLGRSIANDLLAGLGLPPLPATFTVVATTQTGTIVLHLTGVEAESEDDAIRSVFDNLTVTVTVPTVQYLPDYVGEGEVNAVYMFTDRNPQVDATLGQTWLESLSLTAEEE